MATLKKIYKVKVTILQGADFVVRLINAKTAAQAVAHVVKDSVTVCLLSVQDARTHADLDIEEAGE